MANIITGLRIVISAVLLFCPAFSPVFYVLYLSAGFSDMIDGTVARKTNTADEFGAKLDTAADFVFAAVCMLKLLPKMLMPLWLYIWIAGIAAIKAFNIAAGFIRQKHFPAVHSIMNKLTGGMLFVLPLKSHRHSAPRESCILQASFTTISRYVLQKYEKYVDYRSIY